MNIALAEIKWFNVDDRNMVYVSKYINWACRFHPNITLHWIYARGASNYVAFNHNKSC